MNNKKQTAVFIGSSILLDSCVEASKNLFNKIYIVTDEIKLIKKYKKNYKIIKFENLHKYNFDYLFSILNKRIISDKILKKINLLAINFHDGPLPKYAGLYSSTWALLNNEKYHGCCWHKVETKIDTGEILESIKFKINYNDTAYKVDTKSTYLGKKLFEKIIFRIKKNNLKGVKQNKKLRRYFGNKNFLKLPSCGFINYQKPFKENFNLFKALNFSEKKENKLSKFKILINDKPFIVNKLQLINLKNKEDFKIGYIKILNKELIIMKCKNYLLKVNFYNPNNLKLRSSHQIISNKKFSQFAKFGLNSTALKKKRSKKLHIKNNVYSYFKKSEKKLTNMIVQLINSTFKNIKSNSSRIKTLGLGKHIEWDSLGHMKYLHNIERKFKIKINEKNIDYFNNVTDTIIYLSRIKNK